MQEYIYGVPYAEPPVMELPTRYAHFNETILKHAPLDYSHLVDGNGRTVERVDAPTPLIVEVQHAIQDYPRRILDLGAEVGKHSIYLAAQGHYVTAIDRSSESIEYAKESARQLGITEQHLRLVHKDAADYLSSSDKFDVVLANMVLHFLKPDKAVQTIKLAQQVTADNGVNCISNFTNNNPEQEKERSLRHYLVDAGELASMYSSTEWRIVHDFSGDAPKYLKRNPREGMVFLPNISELIAEKKRATFQQLGRTTLRGMDPEYWRRSDPEYYQLLMESGE